MIDLQGSLFDTPLGSQTIALRFTKVLISQSPLFYITATSISTAIDIAIVP